MESRTEAGDRGSIKWEINPEGMFLSVNSNYCESTGYSEKELSGKNMNLFLREREAEQFNKLLPELVKGKQWKGLMRRTRPTGEEVWLMTSIAPVKDEEEKVVKIILLAQDVTENKLKYQLLEDANKEIDKLKDQISKNSE
jgi:methyl-accepting chemotaxis protein